MKEWLKFDTAWELLGINSEEKYIERFIVKGKFHDDVPEEIKIGFQTVEHLMAHAFYHIELYNEAFNKCMRLFEVSLKFKCQQIGVSITNSNSREKSLNNLIHELCRKPNYNSLKNQYNWFRQLRNMEMHPSGGGYLGAFFNHTSKFKLFVNIINHLFLEENKLSNLLRIQETVHNSINSFNKKFYTVLINDKKYLIKNIINHKIINCKNETALVIIVSPVLTDTYNYLSQYSSKPLNILVNDFTIGNNSIVGKTENKFFFELTTDNKEENIKTVSIFDNDLERLDDITRSNYEIHLKHRALLDIINLTYYNSYF